MVREFVLDQRTRRNPYAPPRAVTAAAQIVFGPSVPRTAAKSTKQGWQDEAWQLRDEIGEFRFSGDRIAKTVSLMRPFVGKVESLGDEPVEVIEGLPAELGERMFADQSATQQRMFRAAQHIAFNGETLPVIREDIDTDLFSWEPCSVQELTPAGSSWQYSNGLDTRRLDPVTERVTRAWIPHPSQSAYADCGARAILPVARELRGLTEHVSAQIDSRLAGAGLLLVAQEIESLRGQGSPSGADDEDDIDPFVRDLMEMMLTPIKDRASAAALVPLVAKVPAQYVDKIKHIRFSEPLDPKAQELRAEAIRRIALGMDSPPEVLLGLGSGSNHWSAWAIGEDDVKLAAAPVAVIIFHALTVGWLHPMLRESGVADWHKYVIWYDASALRLRPDRSPDARELFDRGALSEEAMLRENGFGAADLPTEDEKHKILITKLLIGAPSLAPLLLPLLGIEVNTAVLRQTSEIAEATSGDAPKPGTTSAEGPPPAADPSGQRSLPEEPTSTQPDDTAPERP
ncbi:hypothetical protein [Nocardia farcinica]